MDPAAPARAGLADVRESYGFQLRGWRLQRLGWLALALAIAASTATRLGPDPVFRVAVVYGFLLVLLRLAGRRTLGEMSPFDFVLLLIISEMVQQALVHEDPSLTRAAVLCGTLVLLDVVLSLGKQRSRGLRRWLEGVPVILVEQGRALPDVLRHARVDEDDVLAAARDRHGLERIEQIRYAILECSGSISIIPRDASCAPETLRSGGADARGSRPRECD
jgi:uncharacterized membrane protein YcaP (DUF421 family)